MILMTLFAVLGLTSAVYAHLQARRYIATKAGAITTHLILLGLGLVFGYVTADTYPEPPLRWLAFLVGFGAVHIPPAIVLLIKRARHSPKS